MSNEDIETAQMDVMLRTLDGWFLLTPELTHDAVVAWLESVKCRECNGVIPPENLVFIDEILEAKLISE